MNREDYGTDGHLNEHKLKGDFEINELDSLSSVEDDKHIEDINQTENDDILVYETSQPNASLCIQRSLTKDPLSFLMKIERQYLPKYKQRKSVGALSNGRLSKQREAFYARLSKPKRILNEDKRSYSKDSIQVIKRGSQIGEQAANRLYELSRDLSTKKERLKREHEEEINKRYLFSPHINRLKASTSKMTDVPLLQRFQAFEEARKQSLNRRIEEKERFETFTYQPFLNENSILIVNQMNESNKSTHTSKQLYTETRHLRDSHSTEEELECSFNPMTLSKISNQSSGNIKSFLRRCGDYAEGSRQLKEKQVKRNELELNRKHTFKPRINLSSEFLTSFINEKPKERYNRMSRVAYDSISAKKEQLKEKYDSQYQYKPCLNTNYTASPIRAKSTSKTSKDLSQKSELEASYTFKPQINSSKYPELQSQYLNDSNIMPRIESELKKREEKISQYQMLLNEKEIGECVFSPTINHSSPDYTTQPEVKGYNQYVEGMKLVRLKKQLKEEEMQARFFTSEYCNRREPGITKPLPFNLSTKLGCKSSFYQQSRLTWKDHEKNRTEIRRMLEELDD